MTIERSAWDALQAAISRDTPACLGDNRFLGDGRGGLATRDLAAICAECPIRRECGEYATSLRYRIAGFWAGRWRGKRLLDADDLAVLPRPQTMV